MADHDARRSGAARGWTLAVLGALLPLLVALGTSIWTTPYPVGETIAILEDIQNPHESFFDPTVRAWYRPLYFATWDWFLRSTGSLDTALALFKALQVAAPMSLVLLLVWELRPRTMLEAAAAWCAAAVLIGTPGFRDNLEVPLLMTLVGMPLAMAVWMLLVRPGSLLRGALVVLLTFVAIGFKEQGLVLAPVVVAAWWTRAPGAGTLLTATHVAATCGYLAFRLLHSGNWPIFEQSMGLWFDIIEPRDAMARFGDWPYGLYAYNVAGTILNVLVGEPSGGLFAIARDAYYWRVQPWEVIYLIGACGLTGTIAWWTWRVCPGLGREGWTHEARVAAAFVVALLASGALAYHYSRDRLGGMAAVFYALAAYEAMRHLVRHAVEQPPPGSRRVGWAVALLAAVSFSWQIHAVGTLEWTRRRAEVNTLGWLTLLAPRRVEFADRPTYVRILDHMARQGTDPHAARPTNYPELLQKTLAAEVPR